MGFGLDGIVAEGTAGLRKISEKEAAIAALKTLDAHKMFIALPPFARQRLPTPFAWMARRAADMEKQKASIEQLRLGPGGVIPRALVNVYRQPIRISDSELPQWFLICLCCKRLSSHPRILYPPPHPRILYPPPASPHPRIPASRPSGSHAPSSGHPECLLAASGLWFVEEHLVGSIVESRSRRIMETDSPATLASRLRPFERIARHHLGAPTSIPGAPSASSRATQRARPPFSAPTVSVSAATTPAALVPPHEWKPRGSSSEPRPRSPRPPSRPPERNPATDRSPSPASGRSGSSSSASSAPSPRRERIRIRRRRRRAALAAAQAQLPASLPSTPPAIPIPLPLPPPYGAPLAPTAPGQLLLPITMLVSLGLRQLLQQTAGQQPPPLPAAHQGPIPLMGLSVPQPPPPALAIPGLPFATVPQTLALPPASASPLGYAAPALQRADGMMVSLTPTAQSLPAPPLACAPDMPPPGAHPPPRGLAPASLALPPASPKLPTQHRPRAPLRGPISLLCGRCTASVGRVLELHQPSFGQRKVYDFSPTGCGFENRQTGRTVTVTDWIARVEIQ
ncbi:hypothetical protein PAPYR_4427 [Paratrimastix pyriformis]|uniref:Uncharacterized protein n=1 Tax=Paratrimastix pyriformis TaxID=342808 RepID=A0ABQ8UKD6_9EUKA|nr:hypothetical protein PAPYR_4427 [Paratrimastix pyriformis]